MSKNEKAYFEDLNVGCTCPHEDAFVPDGEKVYFRKLKGNNATEDSFIAPPFNAALIDRADACIQKLLSVFALSCEKSMSPEMQLSEAGIQFAS